MCFFCILICFLYVIQVEKLLLLCPSESHGGVFRVDQRGQDAVVALGVYLLESGQQHQTLILQYLLKLLRALAKTVWLDEKRIYPTDRKLTASQ